VFLLAKKLEIESNKSFEKDGITTKQWLVLATIEQHATSLSLSDIAKALDMSHQNAKNIVLQLEKKGFATIEKDNDDKRTLRIATTAKSRSMWKKRNDLDRENIDGFLSPLDFKESIRFSEMLHRLLESIGKK